MAAYWYGSLCWIGMVAYAGLVWHPIGMEAYAGLEW